MRLTDRPKTLAEMKPDVPWPEELQAVMDRGLARDAKDRYQNANELGRDLVKAVQHMPMTVAAEMGTAVLGAVPPTRVAPGRASSPGGAGATKVAAAEPAPLATPVRAKSRMPILAGGGVVAALIAGGAFMATRNKTADAVTPDTARHVAAAVPSGSDTAPASGAARPSKPATSDSAGRTQAPAGSRVVPAPNTKTGTTTPGPVTGGRTEALAPAYDAQTMFARVDKLVGSSETADLQRALILLGDALPRLVTHEDSIRALYLRASTMAVVDEKNDRACPILQRIMDQPPAKYTVAASTSFKEFGCQ